MTDDRDCDQIMNDINDTLSSLDGFLSIKLYDSDWHDVRATLKQVDTRLKTLLDMELGNV